MTYDSFIQQKETHRKKKADRGSEAVYNYLLLGVPRSTRPPHYFVKICDLENIATANHPLPLIPVEQLSADGKRIFTKYWLNASGRPVQEQCG